MTAPRDAPTALLLDVDGTLLDTVYAHVHAWWLAFEDAGHRVSADDTGTFREKLGCDDVLHAVVTSGDVENAKPAPDIVAAALEAAGCATPAPSRSTATCSRASTAAPWARRPS